jgi:hypothetical protein
MSLFGSIKNTYQKSVAAVVIQNLLEHKVKANIFDLDPASIANKLVTEVWDQKPDIYSGKFDQRPHKLAVAAAALANGIHLFEEDDVNRYALILSLGSILSEVEVNGRLYPFNSLDRLLLQEAQAEYYEAAGELASLDDLDNETSNTIPRASLSAGEEVSDVAATLTKLTDMVVKKYVSLPHNQLAQAISHDFNGKSCHIDAHGVSFVFAELPDFQFNLLTADSSRYGFWVAGRRQYAGFLLDVNGSDWDCSANDGISYRATVEAKKLAEVMGKKYGAR